MPRIGNLVCILPWTSVHVNRSLPAIRVVDISNPEFPGINAFDSGFIGPNPTPEQHPHMRLEATMTSVPKVYPGDMVFWHCDLIHSVEIEHTGTGDSAGTTFHLRVVHFMQPS
jgi:hypothetical protein